MDNYYKQQNLGFINNNNIEKSDLAAKGLHLKVRGRGKLVKNVIEYVYWKCGIGRSILNDIRQKSATTVKALSKNEKCHPKLLIEA